MAADRVPDWLGSYSESDVRMLAEVISTTATCEHDLNVMEAQLNALVELGSSGFGGPEYMPRLRDMDLTRLPRNLVEYVEDLLETQ